MDVFDLVATLSLDTSKAESGLSGFSSKISGAMSGVTGFVGGAAKAAVAATAAATTALTGFVGGAAKVGSEFDSAMSQVSATLGYTTEDIENNVNGAGDAFAALQEKAEEAGRSTIFSASESAEGLNILAMSGYDAEQSIAMLDDVLHLAAAGSMDMASAAGYVSGAMKGFNDDTKDSAYYADLMAKGATLANTSVEQLGEAMSGGSATAASYSQSAESMTIALLRLAEQGEVGSAASTALNAAMKDLYTGSDQAKKALQELGVDAYDPVTREARDFNDVVNDLEASMEGMTEEQKNNYKQTIFGIQGLNAYNKMVVTSKDRQDEWAQSLANATGEASKQYGTMTDNLEGDVAAWNSALDGFKISISKGVMPSIREFVQFGTDGLSKITDAFKRGGIKEAMAEFGTQLSDGVEMIMEKLPDAADAGFELIKALGGGIVDNLGLITKAATQIITKFSQSFKVSDLMKTASEVVTNLLTAIQDNIPTVAPMIVEFIVGLAQLIADNAEQTIDAAIEIAAAIGEGLIEAAPILAEKVPDIIDALIMAFQEHPEALALLGPMFMGNIIDGIKGSHSLFSKAFEGIGNHIDPGKLASEIGKPISSAFSKLGPTISGGLSSFASFMTADIGTTMAAGGAAAAGTAAAAIGGSIVAAIAGLEIGKKIGAAIFPDDAELYESYSGIEGSWEMLKEAGGLMVERLGEHWENLKSKTEEIWSGIKESIEEAVTSFVNDAVDKINRLKTKITEAWTSIKNKTVEVWNGVKTAVTTAVSNLVTRVTTSITNLKTTIADKWDDIKTKATETWTAIKESIVGLAENISEGILKPLSDMVDNVKTKFTEATDFIKELAGKAKDWGTDMINNFISGIKKGAKDLKTAAEGAAKTVKDRLGFSEPKEGPLSDFHTYAPDMIDLFVNGIRDNENRLATAVEEAFNFGENITDGGIFTSGGRSSAAGQTPEKNVTVILQLDKTQLAKTVFQLNKEETKRVGLELANV